MTHSGHLLSGALASLYPFLVASQSLNTTGAICAGGFALLGSLAPDFLEIPYPKFKKKSRVWFLPDKTITVHGRVFAHRGITHSILLWMALYLFAFYALHNAGNIFDSFSMLKQSAIGRTINDPYFSACLLGFTFGALIHLAGDFPNKTGLPLLYPFSYRVGLDLWNSGNHEIEMNVTLLILLLPLLYLTYEHPGVDMFLLLWNLCVGLF